MSFFIDFIIIAIIITNIIVYTKKGLVSVAIDIAGFIFSVVIAWSFSAKVGGFLLGIMKKLIPDENGGIVSDILSSTAVSRILAFIAIFFVLIIVVKIIVKLAQKIRIPVLSSIDRLLGGLLGLVLGLAWAQIASMVVFALLEILANTSSSFPVEAFSSLKVTRWFFEFNIFKMVFAAV
jgi:uncharacterized membrane protein required for colicin V production